MRLGPTTDVPDDRCLNCGRLVEAATQLADSERDARPRPGSITICIGCGHIMAFDRKMKLRELTDAEMTAVAGDPRVVTFQNLRRQLNASRSDRPKRTRRDWRDV